jgi:radical SAM protein with 4Fe4S-binding SPASM domain
MTDFKLFNLQIELNDVCNLECLHCYQVREKVKEELDINIVFNQLDELKKVTGYSNFFFRLSGGEVTLRKDLFKIIRKIKDLGHYVEIITNGVLLDIDYVYALKVSCTDIVQVSLDGSNKEIHDYIRGKGNFEKTINGIKNLLKANIPVEIKFTIINNVNNNDIYNMFNLCNQLGIKYISIGRFIFAGNGMKFLKEGNFIGNDLKNAFYSIIKAGQEFPNLNIRIRDQLIRIVNQLNELEIPKNVNTNQKQYIGINYLALDTYGNVYADRQMNLILGNIHKKSLSDIWKKSKKLNKFRNLKKYLKGKCLKCNLNEICLGGNKTASYSLTGDPFEPDPGCWL